MNDRTELASRYNAERQHLAALEASIRGKRCLRCGEVPRIAWIDGDHAIRCACHPGAPVLAHSDPQKERLKNMVEANLARMDQGEVGRALATLTVHDIKAMLCPNATDAEAGLFLRFCMAEQLNPFQRDAYLIKYDKNGAASIVIGVGAFLKRAARHPDYRGYASGIVVQDVDKAIVNRIGSMDHPGDTLIGGWARVFMAGRQPFEHAVSVKEYRRKSPLWDQQPATMVEKVAYAQALKRCIPEIDRFRDRGEAMTVDVTVEDRPPSDDNRAQDAPSARLEANAPQTTPQVAIPPSALPRAQDGPPAALPPWPKTYPETAAGLVKRLGDEDGDQSGKILKTLNVWSKGKIQDTLAGVEAYGVRAAYALWREVRPLKEAGGLFG